MATLPLSSLVRTGSGSLPQPLDGSGVTFWYSGRVAIYQAIQALGLVPGDRVALPAFSCGSEIDPYVSAGLVPRFFGVTETLDPELKSFEIAVEGARAAMVTHYFGFGARLESVRVRCREAGVPLIEDCAHGLYSRDNHGWLGSQADIAVFSIAKTLPVPDGGALLLPEHLSVKASASPPPNRLVRKRMGSLLISHLQAHANRTVSRLAYLPHSIKRALRVTDREPDRGSQAGLAYIARLDRMLAATGMSSIALRLLMQTDVGEVGERRRKNYARLLEALRPVTAVRPAFPQLPDQSCPLAMPVLVSNPQSFRSTIAAGPRIGSKQVWPWFHPAVPWSHFRHEAHLKKTLFTLPVHHVLNDREMNSMVEAIRTWS